MATLDYANPRPERTRALRNGAIFIPSIASIAVYVACCLWLQSSAAAGDFLLIMIVVAEITTIVLLCAWRRLHLMVIVGGWLLVGLWAAFLGFVTLVNLGVLKE